MGTANSSSAGDCSLALDQGCFGYLERLHSWTPLSCSEALIFGSCEQRKRNNIPPDWRKPSISSLPDPKVTAPEHAMCNHNPLNSKPSQTTMKQRAECDPM
eukprot:scaffold147339_cov35-Prasinocladus_malaysianus.AAC.2